MKAIEIAENKPTTENVWKTKAGALIDMEEMTREQLQGALVISQKKQVDGFMKLSLGLELETKLLIVAKKKNIQLNPLNEEKDTLLSQKYAKFKEILTSLGRSIKRKKKEQNAKTETVS